MHDTVSLLVLGPYGWVQTGTFFFMALAVAVLVAKLIRKSSGDRRFKAGVGILALLPAGLIIIGTNPTVLPGEPQTWQSIVHLQTTAALVFIFPTSCFLMAPGLGARLFEKKWLHQFTHLAGIGSLAFLILTAVLVLNNLGWVGFSERLLMANGLTWLQVLNLQALRI